ncbi:MAG: hypothetical protein HXY34_12060, partial [Candidatus Thorarchaeota archaeon]|nr:hypothetical protein [Candidatus Thorarchaeota archaeon]
DEVPAGNLAFITGLADVLAGDTLVAPELHGMEPLDRLQMPTEPVVTYTVEPKMLRDLSTIQKPIMDFVRSDPALEFTVNPDTGEMLLSGAGELHIEIATEKLRRIGVEIQLGRPVVVIKEQMTRDGPLCEGGGPETSRFSARAVLSRPDLSGHTGNVLDSEPRSDCHLIDSTGTIDPKSQEAQWVREAFRTAINRGPKRGERMRGVTVIIESAEVRLESEEMSWRDITQPLLDAIRASICGGQPELVQPWARLEISSPEEHVGTVTAILMRRKGRVLEMDSERTLYRIEAELPVSESFGLANELRTATSGWATWGARPGEYRPLGNG